MGLTSLLVAIVDEGDSCQSNPDTEQKITTDGQEIVDQHQINEVFSSHQISSQTENSQNVDICNINNGGCEQLCISVNDSTTKCNCTKGYSINVANPKKL